MNIYLETKIDSRGINRVYDALCKYITEDLKIVANEKEADLVILHVNGRNDRNIARAKDILKRGKKYAVVQYCLRSTKRPHTKNWTWLWENAELVWSYYDLTRELRLDNQECKFNFYHAPLGADSEVFYSKPDIEKKYMICTSGLHYLTESVRECIHAAKAVGGRVAHLGSGVDPITGDVDVFTGLSDDEVRELYLQCHFVSGLRTKEGFELPAVEGLLCGVKPIMFKTPNYKQWYDGHALFIPEGKREDTLKHLTDIFKHPEAGVASGASMVIAKDQFNWERVITNFWERLCKH